MGVTIKVNGTSNSLVHQGSNGFAKSTAPDVCKTPSPGGPVPIPYPIILSMSSDLSNGTTTVKVDGGNMAAIKGSEFSSCSGDEAGTAGGVVSSTNMKEAKWLLYSFDVKMDGANACRLSDKMTMNHGNTFCMGGEMQPPVPPAVPSPQPKGCQCKKGTSAKNRDKVNKGSDGKKPRCAICGKTAAECASLKIREKASELSSAIDPVKRKEIRASIKRWKKRKRLEADHKFPSSKIKMMKDFKKLEENDLDGAKKIMHDQANMRGLCKSCNAGLQDKSKFQGADIIAKIKAALAS